MSTNWGRAEQRERERERERESEAGSTLTAKKPTRGWNPLTVRS